MSACCKGSALTGEHDASCAIGKAAGEAAPEYTTPAEAVRRQLTPEDRAKLEAMIDAVKKAALDALQNYRKDPKDAP